ncbi:hypothetical protein CQA53_03775 [Helicobacter didelphidarum]|uniref:Uncharacterized protein n=1 Tax=Helicobacter didelphidarum TaxID=2040648 RepID=A0A3D8IMD8_9HELI|nr:hypothetical protein [Helicobacter didelphidarum]RDU66352.1 hypothetical protein CQA53_03775 [Helicobacter didelphidarum]
MLYKAILYLINTIELIQFHAYISFRFNTYSTFFYDQNHIIKSTQCIESCFMLLHKKPYFRETNQ